MSLLFVMMSVQKVMMRKRERVEEGANGDYSNFSIRKKYFVKIKLMIEEDDEQYSKLTLNCNKNRLFSNESDDEQYFA